MRYDSARCEAFLSFDFAQDEPTFSDNRFFFLLIGHLQSVQPAGPKITLRFPRVFVSM